MNQCVNKNLWLIVGARYQKDFFWEPKFKNLNIRYIPVLSRQDNDWNGAKGICSRYSIKRKY